MLKKFWIVTNDGKDTNHAVTEKVKELLEIAGRSCILCEKDAEKNIIRERIPDMIDCAIVIGGDGSLIEVARTLWKRDVPILGINMGTLGYLTEVEVSNLAEDITQMLKGDYLYEERMMLEGMFPNGKKDVALNDIVVSRKGDDLRIIYFKLFVNGELLNSYEADGIIISTPTGSTAYNMSAGGPIVEPTASLTVITPICSHALNTRSIVLSSDDEIVIEIGEGRRGNIEKVLVTFDGATSVPLETGDRLTICKAKESTKIMKINKKELIVGNTAYVVTKKYDSDQMKQVYHIVPAEIKKVGRKYITVTVQYWDQEFCLKDDGVIYEFALNNKTNGANNVLCLSEEDAKKHILKQNLLMEFRNKRFYENDCNLDQLLLMKAGYHYDPTGPMAEHWQKILEYEKDNY